MWTVETFEPIYQEYLGSGLNIREYCISRGFSESKFYRWQRKMRKAAALASAKNDTFLPVSINNHDGKVVIVDTKQIGSVPAHKPQDPPCVTGSSAHVQFDISYTDGTRVKLTGTLDRDIIAMLLSR